jgi:Guanine nucleotide exchange factor synembryn
MLSGCLLIVLYLVGRFVKYTGYGNAAGLLAQRGLMCGGHGTGVEYSSESEDSETEEYGQLKEGLGCIANVLCLTCPCCITVRLVEKWNFLLWYSFSW